MSAPDIMIGALIFPLAVAIGAGSSWLIFEGIEKRDWFGLFLGASLFIVGALTLIVMVAAP